LKKEAPVAATVDDVKIALERYRNVVSYLQYENTMFWTRLGFTFTLQAIILGVALGALGRASENSASAVLAEAACLLSVLVGLIGVLLAQQANKWIYRWISILEKELEETAYAKIEVFRARPNGSLQSLGYCLLGVLIATGLLLFFFSFRIAHLHPIAATDHPISPWSVIVSGLGLVLGTIAAGLMFWFPPSLASYTEEGQRHAAFVHPSTEEGRRIGRRQAKLSWLGPLMLALGFILQAAAMVLQLEGK
jgi:hypothetical protein